MIYDKAKFRFIYSDPPPTSVISTNPASENGIVGSPFNVNVVASSSEEAFNAVQATVTISSNLEIIGLSNPTSNACNLSYTQTPTTSNPSFAGGIYNGSSQDCVVYTLTLKPTEEGTGTITLSNGSMKAYDDHGEILDNVTNGTYTISAATPTPSPSPLAQLTINYPFQTYASLLNLDGTRDSLITQVFLNGSDASTTYPTSTTWEAPVGLNLGANSVIVYGKGAEGNQTATQNITINRHTLGDINGDTFINLIDASLFAVDWGKTENLTYNLSDMNDDGVVDLTDLSILAKLLQ